MASLACRRLEMPTASMSGKCHENDGSNMTTSKHQDSRSTRLLSCSLRDRNVFLGSASGTGGSELGRSPSLAAATTHDLGASKCIFLDTGHTLQASKRLHRAHHNLSAAHRPEVTDRAQTSMHGEGATLNEIVTMDRSASTTSLFSMSSNSNEEEASTCTSSEISSDARRSPQNEGPLDTLKTLYEAPPLKRGLSSSFSGKSQSFSSLAEVRSVVDLAKPENRFVKRRRTEKQACYRPRSAAAAGISKRPNMSFLAKLEAMPTRPFKRL